MIRIEVDQAINKITKEIGCLNTGNNAVACMRAINRSLEQGRSRIRSAIRGIYKIPGNKIMEDIVNENASRFILIGYIKAKTKPLLLDSFSPRFETSAASISISRSGIRRQRKFKRRKGTVTSGVTVEVIKGKKTNLPYAFMLASGQPRVFARGQYTGNGFLLRHKRVNRSGSDNPIKPLLSVSLYSAIMNERVTTGVTMLMQYIFQDRLTHEIKRTMSNNSA